MTTSAILGIPYISNQQSQPDVTHNEAVSNLQMLLAGGVILVGLNDPPGSPAEGDMYIIGESPTGSWAGRPNSIAGFFLGDWLFVPGDDSNGTPIVMSADQEGLEVFVKPDNAKFVWSDLGSSPGIFSWSALPTNISTLAALNDTVITSPSDRNFLQFTDGFWRNTPTNAVIVNSAADFPAPSGGVITLEDGLNYFIVNTFSMSDRIVVGVDNLITATNTQGKVLTYTGTGTMFTGVDKNFTIRDVTVSSPNGQTFDFSDTTPGVHIFFLKDAIVQSCKKYGTFTDLGNFVLANANCLNADDGITIDGVAYLIISIEKFALVSSSTSFGGVDISGAIATDIEFDNLVFVAPAGSPEESFGIKGAVDSGNLPAGAIGTITNSTFAGGLTPLVNITTDDIRWDFRGSTANVPDTMQDALLCLENNATETVISASSTPTLVAGTWVGVRSSHFTTDANGRATYIGERPLVTPADVAVSMEPASGTNKDLKLYLAVNGAFISGTGMLIRADSGNPLHNSTIWQLELNENDFLEVFVSNESDTVNVLVSDAVFRIR